MKILVAILSVLAIGQAQVEVRLPFGNPAGVTLTGAGFANNFNFQPQQPFPRLQQPQAQPQSAEQPQPLEQAQQNGAEPIPQELDQAQPLSAEQQAVQYQNAQYAHQQQAAQFQNAQFAQQQEAQQQANAQFAQQQEAQQQAAQFQNAQFAQQHEAQQQANAQFAQQQEAQHAYAAAPVAQPAPVHTYAAAPAPVHTYAAAPVQYHRAVQYAAPAPVLHQKVAYAAPAVAVHQKVGYAATPVLTKVPGVADVPITKLAYSHGYTQKEIDVATPAVSTRRVKVRRPALRKEFYDIEHRVIVRPAGSATLELSQPISKEQKGPAVLTPTKFAHIAPVVRYGASRRIIDGDQSSGFGLRNAQPAQAPEQPQAQPQQAQPPQQPEPQAAQPRNAGPPPRFQRQRQQPAQAQPRQAVDEDTEVVEAAPQPQPPQGREDIPSDPQQQQPQPIQDEQPQPAPGGPQEGAPQPQPAPRPPQGPQNGLIITPDMPLALQNRLIELLTGKGGTVTEILNQDGSPADSASVLQVADALGDPSLQGGERITTRRIVVTRPIETIQEIEVQEPATKILRKTVQQPTLFKHHVPAIARVPVAVPAVKHVATPVVKTTYTAAHPAAYTFNYQAPQFSYSH